MSVPLARALRPGDWRQLLEDWRDPRACLLLFAREAEVEIELIVGRRHPGKAPAHAPLVRLQLFERGPRDAEHGHVARLQMGDDPVESVRDRRAGRAAG